MPIGKVTHVFAPVRCVAIRTSVVLVAGDVLRYEKGDRERELPGSHLSDHAICSMQIDHRNIDGCLPGDEVAIRIPAGDLPPNNSHVFLRIGSSE
ncbi:MAG: hypothetical protein WC465_05235 [Patescibacteria group bacterium]